MGVIFLLLTFSHNLHAGGVTIVTHGYSGDFSYPSWVTMMKTAVKGRITNGTVATYKLRLLSLNSADQQFGLSMDYDSSLFYSATSGETIIEIDWSLFAGWDWLISSIGFSTEDVGNAIADYMLSSTHFEQYLSETPIHLIGHSRGGGLITQISKRFAEKNIWVDHITFLDAVSAGVIAGPRDAPWGVYDNIVFADNYYQTMGGLILHGNYSSPTLNYNLDSIFINDQLSDFWATDTHGYVHDWYYGTINLQADSISIPRADWYTEYSINQYGFQLSRIANGAGKRLLGVAIDGLSQYHGGMNGNRPYNVTRTGTQWPNIIIENQDGWSVQEGAQYLRIKTIYNAPASATITFLTDNDCNPYTSGSGREIMSYSVSASQNYQTRDQFYYNWYPVSADNGKYLYAKITANGKTRYYYLPQTVNVTPASQISLSGSAVSPSSGTTEGTYTYQAAYTNTSGQTPAEKKVYIDGVTYDMSLSSGSAANGTYQYQKSAFSVGVHNYYYQFKAANGTIVRSPSSGTLSGPTVNSQSSGGTDVRVSARWGEDGYNWGGGYIDAWDPSYYKFFSVGESYWLAAVPSYGWNVAQWRIGYHNGSTFVWTGPTQTSGNSAQLTFQQSVVGQNGYMENEIQCIFQRNNQGNRILTITKKGPGNVSPSEGMSEREINSQVQLQATPNSNGRFLEWRDQNSQALSTNAYISVTMSEDKYVQAVFQYTMTAIYTNDLECTDNVVQQHEPNSHLSGWNVTADTYGSLAVAHYYPGGNERMRTSLLKFNLAPLANASQIQSIKLRLNMTSKPSNLDGYEIRGITTSWSESDMEKTIYKTSDRVPGDDGYRFTPGNYGIVEHVIPESFITTNGLCIRPYWEELTYDAIYGFSHRGNGDPSIRPHLRVIWVGPKLIPAIWVSTNNVNVIGTNGALPSSVVFQVKNADEGTLNYTVTDDVSWLTLTGDTSSSSTGQTRQVTMSFSDSGLSLGTYSGTVTVADNDSSNSNAPVQLPVSFTVLGPHIRVSANSISASAYYNTNPTNNVLGVWNPAYGTLNYTIATNATWLTISPSSGASTGEVDSISVNYNVSGLNTGVYSGTITVSDSVATNSPVTINVQLTVLPPVPSAPLAPIASDGSDTGKVIIAWNAVTWATSYEIWRNTTGNSNSSYKLSNDPSVTNYLDTTATPGTLYYYWVKAKNTTGTSPMSGSNSGYRAISAPSGLVASDGTYTNKVRVTWNSAVGTEGYRIYRHTVNDAGTASLIGNAPGAGFNDTNAAPGTLYYYWVKATNAITSSGFSGVDTGYRMISAPITLNASDGTFTNKVQLAWNSSEGASTYTLWRNASNYSASATNIGISATTNYNDSNTVAGATYYYWVKASNAVCQSAFSLSNYGHKAIMGAPVSPTNTIASDGIYSNKVLVSWSSAASATGYEVWRSTADDFSSAIKISTSDIAANIYEDATGIPGTTYYYWIKAKNTSSISGFGDPRDSGWRGIPPPDVVSATDGTFTDKVRVTWSTVLGATAYTVWRGTNSQSGGAVSIGGDVTTTNYDDATVENATLYYYWVKAKNASLTSAFSMPDSGYSRLISPFGVSASDGIFSDKVRVIWTRSAKASAYLIYRHIANDANTAQILVVLPGTQTGANQFSYDDTSATPETNYYYWIKATNSVCDSPLSASDSGWKGVAPSVTTQPESQTKLPGAPVTFSITAAGSAPLSYQWQKNGVNIAGATAASFTIGSVAERDEGAYRCLVINLCESTLSAEANLTVIDVGTLATPTQVRASDGIYTHMIQVTWTVVSGASFYEVWRSANNNTANASNLGTTVTTTYDDLAAATTPGTIMYYWVKAKTATALSQFSLSDSGYCRSPTPSGSADLSISSVLFDPVVIQQGQHPELLMLMLANNGPDAMNDSPVNFAFYLSGNDVFEDGDDQWMGDYSANKTIPVGGYTTAILSEVGLAGVTIPPVPDGNYYVFAKAQHASTLTDPDENNNVCKRTGTIQIGATAGLKIPVSGDFDGDGKTDLALYQEATGTWQIRFSGSEYGLLEVPGLGGSGLTTLAGDFDGDGKDDPVIYNEATGDWKVWKSLSGYVPVTVNLGGLGFKPTLGDYNGMLMEDMAVYQEARGYWLIILSETTALSYYEFGADGYIPVTGDYDGDGKTDMALYEQSSGNWHVKLSSVGDVEASLDGFGGTGYRPVIADYDGDRLADLALYHETMGTWMVRLSAAGYAVAGLEGFGGSGYVPVPGDFDGDGLADLVIYETATSTWTFRLSSMGYAPLSVVF